MRPTIAYQPALDGVRALAVIAVLLFHAGVPGFSGGYLGVSVFFTLSGYLITSLVVHEHATTGRVDLGAFYARRLRRLLPASAAGLAAIVVAARVTDWFDRVEDLRAHVLGAVFQVVNWVFLAGRGSYQDLLAEHSGTPSPLEHFWSLAIEEQFYWVWPPFLALLLTRVAAPRRRHATVAAVTGVALVAAPVVAAVWGADAAYWATPARIGEILAGAWLAVALANRRTGVAGALDRRWGWLAPTALLALGVCVVTWPAAGGPAYHGGLPLVAVGSVALLVGLQVAGPTQRALSWAPLVSLGKISYGVYVYHWPVYVVLDEDRTRFDGVTLLLVRLAVTLTLSVLSYVAIEQPIRHAAGPRRITFAGAATSAAVVAVAAIALVPSGLSEYWRTDAATVQAAAIDVADTAPLVAAPPATAPTAGPNTTAGPGTAPARRAARAPSAAPAGSPVTAPASSPVTAPVAGRVVATAPVTTDAAVPTLAPLPPLTRPVRIVVTGDSTADALGTGLVEWAAGDPQRAQVEVAASLGCGFITGGERRYGEGSRPDNCAGWMETQLYPVIERTRPDVVAVMSTVWDVIDRRFDGGELISPFDPAYRERQLSAYTELVERLLAAGASRVAFVHEPVPDVWWDPQVYNEDEPARHLALREVYDQIEAAHPDTVTAIPFAEWFTDAGLDDDRESRPDGVHLAPEAAAWLVEEYLGDQLIRAASGLPTRPGIGA